MVGVDCDDLGTAPTTSLRPVAGGGFGHGTELCGLAWEQPGPQVQFLARYAGTAAPENHQQELDASAGTVHFLDILCPAISDRTDIGGGWEYQEGVCCKPAPHASYVGSRSRPADGAGDRLANCASTGGFRLRRHRRLSHLGVGG